LYFEEEEMNRLQIENIKQDRMEVEVLDDDSIIRVKFKGDIDMEDPGVLLDPFFNKLHEGMLAQEIKEVKADFKELNFLNSSGIKAVAKWIMKLTEVDDDRKYSIRIIYNRDITWQVTSLPTLNFLVPGVVKVE
jgi:hypothetical protein